MGRSSATVRSHPRRGFKRVRRAVRGEPARSAEDAVLRRSVAEQTLHDEGLSRQDIHGVDRDTVMVGERHDVTATIRRVLAACGRRGACHVLLVASGVTSTVAAISASYAFSTLGVVLLVGAAAAYRAPDVAFTAPGPEWRRSTTQSDGMTDHDVMERLAIVKERNEYKQELIDDRRDQESGSETPTVSGMGGPP